MTERTQMLAGLGLTLIGIITAIVGGFLVHTAEAPEFNEFGQAIYSGFPRGWIPALIAQSISLGGVLMVLAGLTLIFVYNKPLTWARAMIGALLFTSLMFIIFAIIPNQMLTVFQSTLEWTPQKIFFTIPPAAVLGNDLAISYAALKDMIVAGYVTTALIVVPVAMAYWQGHQTKKDEPKPEPVSKYGRPLRVNT
ncbi:MAG: hypothetical protein ACR2NG_02030 [Acidimicrobiia bacterium]